MSYKVEVIVEAIADSSGGWVGNGLRFDTEELARLYGADLAGRWLIVREWRVVEEGDHDLGGKAHR